MIQAEPLEYFPEGFLIQMIFPSEPSEYYPEEGFLI